MRNSQPKVEISSTVSLMDNLVTLTFVVNTADFVIICNKMCENLTGLKA